MSADPGAGSDRRRSEQAPDASRSSGPLGLLLFFTLVLWLGLGYLFRETPVTLHVPEPDIPDSLQGIYAGWKEAREAARPFVEAKEEMMEEWEAHRQAEAGAAGETRRGGAPPAPAEAPAPRAPAAWNDALDDPALPHGAGAPAAGPRPARGDDLGEL